MTQDTKSPRAADARESIVFSAPYAPPDQAIAAGLLEQASAGIDAERRIDAYATRLIEGIRGNAGGLGGIEDFLHAYSLSTKEGLALMVLAEALLRVPDAATADRLIEDKLATGDWSSHSVKSNALLVAASAWTLGITARIIHPGETPDTILESLLKRLGLPAVRAATRQAMRLLASHFVLGQTIEDALERARAERAVRYSFDMLRRLYDWCIAAANKPYATWLLGIVSFVESSFFPIPPDVMLIPMAIARPDKAWFYATVCTVTSVAGGLLGYLIGALLYDSIGLWLIQLYGYGNKVEAFREAYAQWGGWIILLKGLTPIPYKIVTIASGFAGYNVFLFVLLSIVARGMRFFLLAFLLNRYGAQARSIIEERLGFWVGTAGVLLVGGIIAALYLF